jgi:hypothetical protein
MRRARAKSEDPPAGRVPSYGEGVVSVPFNEAKSKAISWQGQNLKYLNNSNGLTGLHEKLQHRHQSSDGTPK